MNVYIEHLRRLLGFSHSTDNTNISVEACVCVCVCVLCNTDSQAPYIILYII